MADFSFRRRGLAHDKLLTVSGSLLSVMIAATGTVAQTTTVNVFEDNGIQFGGDADWNFNLDTTRLDNGRIIERTITIPEYGPNSKLTAKLHVQAFDDPWDRAGSIWLMTDGGQRIDLHKFITGFNGETYHELDVTSLAPLLQGEVKIQAFVDTWVQQAWAIDFDLEITENQASPHETWAAPVVSSSSWQSGHFEDGPLTFQVVVPEGAQTTQLYYFASGHATDGRSGEEFVTRNHIITVDGEEVLNVRPWRTDCRDFRSVNPTSGRWFDPRTGEVVWSSDFSRSGWCPGDHVEPIVVDFGDTLSPGEHEITFFVDGIRPPDSSGVGFWRVSSYIAGTGDVEPLVLGDMDGNGVLDAFDVDDFELALADKQAYIDSHPGMNPDLIGDFDVNGGLDAFDVDEFETALANAGATAPEPSTVLGVLALGGVLTHRRRRHIATNAHAMTTGPIE